jgi:hypothetical protein
MPVFKTYDALRARLQARLGFGTNAIAASTTLFNDFLQEAEEDLWERYCWPYLRRDVALSFASGQKTIVFPDTISPNRVERLRYDRSGTGDWVNLRERPITTEMERGAPTGPPCVFEFANNEIKFWPVADATYTGEMRGYLRLPATFSSTVPTTVDSGLVFAKALVLAARHYNKQWADKAERDLIMKLRRHREFAIGTATFVRGDSQREDRAETAAVRPVMMPLVYP